MSKRFSGLGLETQSERIRTNLGPIRSDVNAAYDLAAHDIAVFNWLLKAEPEVVSAIGGDFVQYGIQDVVFINLRYPKQQVEKYPRQLAQTPQGSPDDYRGRSTHGDVGRPLNTNPRRNL